MTFILIISSVTMVLAVHAGHNMNKRGVVKYLALTILGGLAFLGCQAWEWTHLYHEGAWWGSNPFPNADGTSIYNQLYKFLFYHYRLSWLSCFSGVIINIIMLIMTLKDTFEREAII